MLDNQVAELVDLLAVVTSRWPSSPVKSLVLRSFNAAPHDFSYALELVCNCKVATSLSLARDLAISQGVFDSIKCCVNRTDFIATTNQVELGFANALSAKQVPLWVLVLLASHLNKSVYLLWAIAMLAFLNFGEFVTQ